jgi:ribonuclease HI
VRNSSFDVYTDGGARGNPGPAAAGGVIISADGSTVAELSQYLGVATNNVAEYRALELTLRKAKELGCQTVVIHMDSELIVRQLNGLYRVKDPKMLELHTQVRRLLRDFADWKVKHVPRSQNKRADELVNQALDAQDGRTREDA